MGTPLLPITDLADKHKGETARIIAKGPSLQYLTPEDVGPGPIIAISEAIAFIETMDFPNTVYSMQKDWPCYLPTKGAAVLLSYHHSRWGHRNYSPRYCFNMEDWFTGTCQYSVVAAIHIANLMGCTAIDLISNDVIANGDKRTFEPSFGRMDHMAGNYKGCKEQVMEAINKFGFPYTLTTPEEKRTPPND